MYLLACICCHVFVICMQHCRQCIYCSYAILPRTFLLYVYVCTCLYVCVCHWHRTQRAALPAPRTDTRHICASDMLCVYICWCVYVSHTYMRVYMSYTCIYVCACLIRIYACIHVLYVWIYACIHVLYRQHISMQHPRTQHQPQTHTTPTHTTQGGALPALCHDPVARSPHVISLRPRGRKSSRSRLWPPVPPSPGHSIHTHTHTHTCQGVSGCVNLSLCVCVCVCACNTHARTCIYMKNSTRVNESGTVHELLNRPWCMYKEWARIGIDAYTKKRWRGEQKAQIHWQSADPLTTCTLPQLWLIMKQWNNETGASVRRPLNRHWCWPERRFGTPPLSLSCLKRGLGWKSLGCLGCKSLGCLSWKGLRCLGWERSRGLDAKSLGWKNLGWKSRKVWGVLGSDLRCVRV